MRGAISPLPQYVFMAWWLVKHRGQLFVSIFRNRHIDISQSYVTRVFHEMRTTEIIGHCCTRYFYQIYEVVSKGFRTESITKSKTTINSRWEATQRFMATQLTKRTHQIAIQLHLVADGCTICRSHSRRPVRKLLVTPSCIASYFIYLMSIVM
jgi:hypothetical protein